MPRTVLEHTQRSADRKRTTARRWRVRLFGNTDLEVAGELIARAFRGDYPIETDSLAGLVILGRNRQFTTPNEILSFVEPVTSELESKLNACETDRK